MYLLGYDIGSSSIKAALVDAETGEPLAVKQFPPQEMDIIATQTGWAEQRPELWWEYVRQATNSVIEASKVDVDQIKGIGISYQMHGLVLIDENQVVLRPSIIWCDSRAVEIGNRAFEKLGRDRCLKQLLNSPGNFTASKLKWVKENEPEVFSRIDKILLPGDYIAMKLTGQTKTTVSGLSEGMFWDFENNDVAKFLLEHYGIGESLIPEVVDTFSNQGQLTHEAADYLGLREGIVVGYRAG